MEVLRLDQQAWLLCLSDSFASAWCLIWMQIYNPGHLWKLKQKLSLRHIEPPTAMKDATRKLLSSADNLVIYQQGFWQPSFCRKHNLWSLSFFFGKNGWCFSLLPSWRKMRINRKLEEWQMDLSSLFFFSIEAMKRKSNLVFLSK